MKKCFIVVVLVFCSFIGAYAQSNLVLNPSFEDSWDTCFPSLDGFSYGQVDSWGAISGSSDYFLPISWNGSNCTTDDNTTGTPINVFGFEYAHTGGCYGGFIFLADSFNTDYEGIQGRFRSPLLAGRTYAVEAYVSLAESSSCISELSFYFSDTELVIPSGRLNYSPQFQNPVSNMITTHFGWQLIQGSYIAHGGEEFLSIGNFTPYYLCHWNNCSDGSALDHVAYLFVDDVAVYDTAVIDTIRLCMNDSTEINGSWYKPSSAIVKEMIGTTIVNHYIESRPESVSYTEIYVPYTRGDTIQIGHNWVCYSEVTYPPHFVCDSVDTFGFCYHQIYLWNTRDTNIDDHFQNIYGCDSTVRYICRTNVGIDEIKNSEITWSVYPNPANDFIQIKLSANDPDKYLVKIMDIAGRSLLSQALDNPHIDITNLKSGIYFVSLYNAKTGKLVGNKKFVKE
jgi:hypothetical protein